MCGPVQFTVYVWSYTVYWGFALSLAAQNSDLFFRSVLIPCTFKPEVNTLVHTRREGERDGGNEGKTGGREEGKPLTTQSKDLYG